MKFAFNRLLVATKVQNKTNISFEMVWLNNSQKHSDEA